MWEVRTKERNVEGVTGAIVPIVDFTLVKDDGVTIKIVSVNRERAMTLEYSDASVTFRFYASRYDSNGKNASDSYQIYSSPSSWRRMIGERKAEIESLLVVIIKNNIIDGLKYYDISSIRAAESPAANFVFHGFETDAPTQ